MKEITDEQALLIAAGAIDRHGLKPAEGDLARFCIKEWIAYGLVLARGARKWTFKKPSCETCKKIIGTVSIESKSSTR